MAVNLAQIRDLLLPGLKGTTGKYDQIPRQWDKVFDKANSKLALERHVEMRYLGLAQAKKEGGQTAFDNLAGQRYTYNQEHFEIALGFSITRKAIDDNQYKQAFGPSVMGLQESFAQTKEVYAADVLNSATTYNTLIGGDGKALCATDHPIDGTTFANRPSTDLDLNESSLLSSMTAVRTNFKDVAGLKIFARARKLVVPPALEAVAIRLTKSELRPGTANNDVNAIMSLSGGLPDGYVVMDFLTSAYAWFLKTNIKGLLYMERVAFEQDMQTEFSTDNLLCKAYERYSFAHYNPRSLYGSFPTS